MLTIFSTPIVGPRVGGVPEIVREDYTGRLVEAWDADGLAARSRSCSKLPITYRIWRLDAACPRVCFGYSGPALR